MIRIYTHAYTYKQIYIFFVNYFARKKARESKKKRSTRNTRKLFKQIQPALV